MNDRGYRVKAAIRRAHDWRMKTSGFNGKYRSPAPRSLIAGEVGVGKSSLIALLLSLAEKDLTFHAYPCIGRIQNENETEATQRFPVAATDCAKPAMWLIDSFGAPSQGGDDHLKHITRLSNGWLNAGDKAKSNNVWFGWDPTMRPDCVVWMHRLDNMNWNNVDDLVRLAAVIKEHESKLAIVVLVSFSTDFGRGSPNVSVQGISDNEHATRAAAVRARCSFLHRNLEFADVRDIPIDEGTYAALLANNDLCEKMDVLLARIVNRSIDVREEVVSGRLKRANSSTSTIAANQAILVRALASQDQRLLQAARVAEQAQRDRDAAQAAADARAQADQAAAEARAREEQEAAARAAADALRIAAESKNREDEVKKAQEAALKRAQEARVNRERERAKVSKQIKAEAEASLAKSSSK
jgi:hypothetical protein